MRSAHSRHHSAVARREPALADDTIHRGQRQWDHARVCLVSHAFENAIGRGRDLAGPGRSWVLGISGRDDLIKGTLQVHTIRSEDLVMRPCNRSQDQGCMLPPTRTPVGFAGRRSTEQKKLLTDRSLINRGPDHRCRELQKENGTPDARVELAAFGLRHQDMSHKSPTL